jgi:flagellar protein FlaG
MDGIASVIKQQATQATQATHTISQDAQSKAPKAEQINTKNTNEILKQESISDKDNGTKITSQSNVVELVSQLNVALKPISTDIQFSVDKDNVFYVSIHEKETDKFLRRFPAEKAEDFLSKMREVTGVLFDTVG